jgi:hypothetical protein
MPDWLIKLAAHIKPGIAAFFAIALANLVLLLLPDAAIKFLTLTEFFKEHRPWIGVALIISTSSCAAYSFAAFAPFIKKSIKAHLAERDRGMILRGVGQNEKAALRMFRDGGWRGCVRSIDDPGFGELHEKGIIFKPAGFTEGKKWLAGMWQVYGWAVEFYQKHPELIDESHIKTG